VEWAATRRRGPRAAAAIVPRAAAELHAAEAEAEGDRTLLLPVAAANITVGDPNHDRIPKWAAATLPINL